MAFSRMTKNVKNVSMLPDAVQGQSNELKNTFDQAGVDLKDALNKLADELELSTSASNLGALKDNAAITVQEYLNSMNTKLSTVEEGANAYSLPEATDEILGGVRIGTTTEIVDGKLEAKGLPAPDNVAREAIFSHAANETIHMTADEKIAIRELQPISTKLVGLSDVSEELLTSVNTGVSGIVQVGDAWKFTITPEMVGKRIVCNLVTNSRWLVLPKPSEVGEGAIVEVMNDITPSDYGSIFIEIETTEGTIKKGNVNDTKCIQPANTIRKYICDGTKWITNFEKVSPDLWVKFVCGTDGKDIEPKYAWAGGNRVFLNLSQLKHFKEYKDILIGITTTTLDENIFLEDCTVRICGNYTEGKLTIPKDYMIFLTSCTLSLSTIIVSIDGTAFGCSGEVGAIIGDLHGIKIKSMSDYGFKLFAYNNGDTYNYNPPNAATLCTSLRLAFEVCAITNDFAGKCNIISTANWHGGANILIDQTSKNGWGAKPSNVFWCNDSDTLSRIGTSGLYTVG